MERSNPSTGGESMTLAEVYRVRYIGDEDKLCGAILAFSYNTRPQYLWKDKKYPGKTPVELDSAYSDYDNYIKGLDLNDYPTIDYSSHILPTGPTEMSIGADEGFCIIFCLFRDFCRTITIPCPRGHPDIFSKPLVRLTESKDGNHIINMFYALFEKALEARIKVKFSNIKCRFGLYGVIAARTSVIVDPAFSSILFFRGEDEKLELEVGEDRNIELLRPIVAVPLGSKLILQFGLCTHDNEKVQVIVPIDVVSVTHKTISTPSVDASWGKCGINVEIEWWCKREPVMSTST